MSRVRARPAKLGRRRRSALAVRVCVIALVLAGHVALLVLGPLTSPLGVSSKTTVASSRRTTVVLVPLPAPRRPTATVQEPSERPTSSRVTAGAPHAQRELQRRAFDAPSVPTETPAPLPTATTGETPADAASQPPLRLGADVLKRAARSSRSDLGQMVESDMASQARAGSRDQKLETAIREAGVPGCLRPDAMKHEPIQLGGLLGLPVLGHAVLTGKCR
jgi:hypothetical protein